MAEDKTKRIRELIGTLRAAGRAYYQESREIMCENLLKTLGLAGAAAAISAAFTYTVCRAILPCTEMIGTLTLVSLKVKLSN